MSCGGGALLASVNGRLTLFSGHSRPQASWDNDLVIAFVAAAAIR
jgi:hypothetical protein